MLDIPFTQSNERFQQNYLEKTGCVIGAMGTRNQVGKGLSYRSASLCSLATQFQSRFLESIPRPIADLSFRLRNQKPASVDISFNFTLHWDDDDIAEKLSTIR
jgi:hypothetical protein